MQIKIDKELLKNDYHLEFSLAEELTEEALENIKRFSEPTVDFGGEVKGFDEDNNEVTLVKLNTNVRKIPSQLPYTRVFKQSQYREKTEEIALAYVESMRAKFDDSLNEFKSKVDNFSDDDEILNY